MRRILILSAVFTVLAAGAEAQEKAPMVEVFGGFSYLHAEKIVAPIVGTGVFTAPSNAGWEAGVNGNFTRWFGLTADFSGHYSNFSTDNTYNFFLFGPTFSHRRPKITAYAHALFGTSRLESEVRFSGVFVARGSDTGAATAVGGGIDYKLGSHWAFRVVQADYLRTSFNDASWSSG